MGRAALQAAAGASGGSAGVLTAGAFLGGMQAWAAAPHVVATIQKRLKQRVT